MVRSRSNWRTRTRSAFDPDMGFWVELFENTDVHRRMYESTSSDGCTVGGFFYSSCVYISKENFDVD